jgi:hypothetical protein
VNRRAFDVSLIAIFFGAATVILIAAGLALLLPGTAAEIVWRLYPARQALLMPYREWLGPGFLALSAVMAAASFGCFARRRWAWGLAVAIFAANGIGDIAQLAMGHVVEGGIGVAVTAAVLFYLSRAATKAAFGQPQRP